MKRFLSLILAVAMIGGILYVAVADVNHGHGPDNGTTQDANGGH